MNSMKRNIINFVFALLSIAIFVQCSSKSKEGKTDDVISYANLYDGRSAFPESVHVSWQNGTLEEVRPVVLKYLDDMIVGITKNIEKYEKVNDLENTEIEKEKRIRVENIKNKVEAAKEKIEIKNAMHGEFRDGGFKDTYGSGK